MFLSVLRKVILYHLSLSVCTYKIDGSSIPIFGCQVHQPEVVRRHFGSKFETSVIQLQYTLPLVALPNRNKGSLASNKLEHFNLTACCNSA